MLSNILPIMMPSSIVQQQAAQTGAGANYVGQSAIAAQYDRMVTAPERGNKEGMRAAAEALVKVLAPENKGGGGGGSGFTGGQTNEDEDSSSNSNQRTKKLPKIPSYLLD